MGTLFHKTHYDVMTKMKVIATSFVVAQFDNISPILLNSPKLF